MLKPFAYILIALSFTGVACSDTVDPITNHFDCHDVCERYKDCFKADYDVDACQDKCESDASNSDTKQNRLDDCSDCLGDSDSCVEDVATCSTSCGAFVP